MLQILFDFFSGKAKTRIYTTFLGWFLVFHIDILFIAIFMDQAIIYEKTNELKGEYIWSHMTNLGLWSLAIEITRIILAIIMTYLMIWVVPRLLNERSYEKELEVEYILRKMKVKKEEELNKKEERVVKKQLENIEAEKQVVVQRAILDETPEHLKWDSEFDKFVDLTNGIDTLREVSNTIYAEGGNLYQYKDVNGWSATPTGVRPDNLALADTNGLVTFSDKGRMLSLTDKGKHFLKRISEYN